MAHPYGLWAAVEPRDVEAKPLAPTDRLAAQLRALNTSVAPAHVTSILNSEPPTKIGFLESQEAQNNSREPRHLKAAHARHSSRQSSPKLWATGFPGFCCLHRCGTVAGHLQPLSIYLSAYRDVYIHTHHVSSGQTNTRSSRAKNLTSQTLPKYLCETGPSRISPARRAPDVFTAKDVEYLQPRGAMTEQTQELMAGHSTEPQSCRLIRVAAQEAIDIRILQSMISGAPLILDLTWKASGQ